MTSFFELKPIRKVAANGTIEAIGLEWIEEASWRYSHRAIFYVMVIPAIIAWVLFGLFCLFGGLGPIVLIIGAALAVVTYRHVWGDLPCRSVILQRDGKIACPHGLPRMKTAKFLRIHQPDVIGFEIGPSISGMQHDWTSSVQAVTQTGETVTVSKVLHREEAREIVVGLNLALHEMRRSVGANTSRNAGRPTQRMLLD